MYILGFEEIEPDDPFEHGWNVRWFKMDPTPVWRDGEPVPQAGQPKLHLVEGDVPSGITPFDRLCLGHFCVRVGDDMDALGRAAEQSGFIERDSGSGRIWLAFGGLRVEVRP
jgi:hypothetical protein